ncbi:MAG: indole-3-glycerol phosphate synthase TrpC [Gammaproteobacteria bacterium]|nr:indole-3-glycerol phosphate synthase TrpC [Gammaproteobacteria bacterium]
MPSDILNQITERKRRDVAERRAGRPLNALIDSLETVGAHLAPRGFRATLVKKADVKQPAVIAEIKKASPSKGIIREQFDVADIAESYATHQADCLSVLTEEHFFQGRDDYLGMARSSVDLPVLRKDFIVDEWQIYESRLLGADCILLIVSALTDAELNRFNQVSRQLGMDVLVEIHDARELQRVLPLQPDLLGVNNRNLRTFETRLDTTLNLLPLIPSNCMLVTESGIHEPGDVERMLDSGVYGFLVGEAFMRSENPGEKLTELFYSR